MAELAKTDRTPDVEKPRNESEFLRQAVKRFNRASEVESMNRKEAVDDLRFKRGEQWPADIKSQRTIEKRPCLTINKCKTFVHQITNDQRQNRPAINVSPVGSRADAKTAQMLKGLIRQIERQSNADVAYDTGFDNAVSNGWGYWRVLTEYEGEDSFDQIIRVGRIRNPFRVYLDPDSQEPDGSDAEWGFISDLVTREDFKEKYPGARPVPFQDSGMGDEYQNWSTQTHVRIAEYFYCEYKKRKLIALANGHTGYEDELDPVILAQTSGQYKAERMVRARNICWDTITSHEVLDHTDWPGKWIPIIKVIGDETDVEGKNHLAGLIRDAKDPQRMYNFWCTAETEMLALAPKAPWIMEEGQVEGHEKEWKDANTKSFPFLLYRGVNTAGKPAPPPQRQQFAGPPVGIVNAKLAAAQDMQAVTGIRFDATLQERMYDESGKALRELKRSSDVGNFHYVDNLARSLRHTGRILIDLIPKIYDTERVLMILREDGSDEMVYIDPNQPQSYQQKPEGQDVKKVFNPKVGTYEVAVTIGPSYATKRAESADSMLMFVKALPNTAAAVSDLIAKNMDWPGAEEIAERLASQLPPNMLNKDITDFPPEAKALVQSLNAQLQKLGQEHQQALAMLGDKEADRTVERDKINKDFEAKLTDIVVTAETKMAGLMQDNISKISDMVTEMRHEFELQNVQAEAGAKINEEKAKAEKLKETGSVRQGDIGHLANMAKEMKDTHQQSMEVMKGVTELLSKKKSATIKGPSGRVFRIESD